MAKSSMANTKPSHTKNHFIPSFYLKQWYPTGSTQFYAANFLSETSRFDCFKPKNSGNVNCYEEKLYWLNSKDEKYRLSLENKAFRTQEAEWAKIIRKLDVSGLNGISEAEKSKLLNFVFNLSLRTPKIVNPLKDADRQKATEAIFKDNYLKGGGTFLEYYEDTTNPAVLDKILNIRLDMIGDFQNTDVYRNHLRHTYGKGSLFVRDLKSNFKLITSNFPVIYGNLIASDSHDTALPLSPNKVLLLISEKSLPEFRKIIAGQTDDNLTISINLGIMKNHKNPMSPEKYQIYSVSSLTDRIIPDEYANNYFF